MVPLYCPWARYLYVVPGHGTFILSLGTVPFLLSLGTVPLYCPWAQYLYIVPGHGTFILSLGTVPLYCPWARYFYHIEALHESGNTVAVAVLTGAIKGTLFLLCECLLKDCSAQDTLSSDVQGCSTILQ